jgi:threonine dehydrogenase-like Zn-dependent dehydrogenase
MYTTTMRYLDDGRIELLELPIADPAPNELQIQGGACGICSWDINTAKYGNQLQPMAPPGHEGVGYVRKIGKDVKGFKEGDRVAGGGFATLRNLSVDRIYKLPESDLADEYWIVEPVSCAVTGLDHCQLRPGDRVAVVGCGFMGLLILQGLLHSPLDQLVVCDINPQRLALARELGVAETYDLSQINAQELAAELKPREFDVVVDTSGAQAGLDLATGIVKRGGLINLFGWLKGQTAYFNPTAWHLGGFRVVNSAPSARLRDPFPPAIRLIHRGIFDLRPLVTHVQPLTDYSSLMSQILSGDPTYIKGVVTLA